MIAYLLIQGFYVRCLGLDTHPEPVVVTKGKRVIDLNHAALKRRVDMEMSVTDAKASLMGGIFRQWNEAEYVEAQRAWLDKLLEFSDVIEPDEQNSAWIDLSTHPDPIATFRMIEERVEFSLGGLASNKWMAKLAVGRDDNLDAVFDPACFLGKLQVGQLPLLTPEQASRLTFLGYSNCGRCLEIPIEVLRKQFGESAITIWNAVRGIGDEPVLPKYPEKSVGDRIYFSKEIEDRSTIEASVLRIADRLSVKLQNEDYFGSSLRLIVVCEEEQQHSALRKFTRPLHDRRSIYMAAMRMFESLKMDKGITSVRIFIPNLEKKTRHQKSFDHLANTEKQARAETAVRCVQKAYGDAAIQKAAELPIPRRHLVLKEWRNATGWT